MAEKLTLKRGKLIVVSACPGAPVGDLISKHHLNRALFLTPEGVSSTVYGNNVMASSGSPESLPRELTGKMTSRAFEGICAARLEEGMATIVCDPWCVSDIERGRYARVAEDVGAEIEFLLMDSTPGAAKDFARHYNLMISDVMDRFERYSPKSIYPFQTYSEKIVFDVDVPTITDSRIDVIGDVHGLSKDLRKMLIEDMGYAIERNTISHPEGRKPLFVGDLVDRGPDSLGVVELVKNSVEAGTAIAIRGNHDQMLIDGMQAIRDYSALKPSSLASGETMQTLLRIDKERRDEIVSFFEKMPLLYIYSDDDKKIAFVHGDVENFDPILTPNSHLMNGDGNMRRKDSDFGYQSIRDEGFNPYMLVRGHRGSTSTQPDIVSLDEAQVFGGNLVGMPLDRTIAIMDLKGASFNSSFEESAVRRKVDYNYGHKRQPERDLYARMEELVNYGFVEKKFDVERGLIQYNASESIYQRNLHRTIPMLEKATGLIVDTGGRIAIHSADKRGRLGNDTPMPQAASRAAIIEQGRGFDVNVSTDPFGKGLLIATSSSMESRYTRMAQESLERQGVYGRINKYLASNRCTLTMRVIHPDDKRSQLGADTTEKHGVLLTSGRLNTPKGGVLSEEELDRVGREIKIDRPAWQYCRFGHAFSQMVMAHYGHDVERDEFFDPSKNYNARPIRGDGTLSPHCYEIFSARRIQKRVEDLMTRKKMEGIVSSEGKSISGDHYVVRESIKGLLRENGKDAVLEMCDLEGLRKRSDISQEEKRSLRNKYSKWKDEQIHKHTEEAFKLSVVNGMDPEIRGLTERVAEAEGHKPKYFPEAEGSTGSGDKKGAKISFKGP